MTIQQEPSACACHVVGVGASAGGLDALCKLLQPLPADAGLAFLVVQHLAPTPPSHLAELLAQRTGWPVTDAVHGEPVRAGQVVVAPAGFGLTLAGGRVQVQRLTPPAGSSQSIDVLLASLAADQGAAGIGVVLSGMGSDGSRGLRALADRGGLCAVQAPASATFDSMPRAALAAVPTAEVGAPEHLGARILAALRSGPEPATAPHLPTTDDIPDPSAAEPLAQVLHLLHARSGHSFKDYKISTLQRRVARRMALLNLSTLADYATALRRNPQEQDLLFSELLIGVTSFFRDPDTWDRLQRQVLPSLMGRAVSDGGPLRAWVPGCSTGEEAYSLAIAWAELADALPGAGACGLQLFATDLNRDAVEHARRGLYGSAQVQGLSQERLQRFFTPTGTGWRVTPALRDHLVFAPHDLGSDPPFTRLHLLMCRNVLIYFDSALQQRLMPVFHYALRPGGILALGGAETVGRQTALFEPVDESARIYQRRDVGPASYVPAFPVRTPIPPTVLAQEHALPNDDAFDDSLPAAMARLMLDDYAPAAVLVNAQGDILWVSGRTGRYLEPAAGKANWNVHVMAREGLRSALSAALRRTRTGDGIEVMPDLTVDVDGGALRVNLTVTRLRAPASLRDQVLIVFRDAPGAIAPPAAEPAATAELRLVREEAGALREEMRRSNEALQASNEELQSANEELMSSKEEVQSMNEELQTINAELQAKVDALTATQNDLKNLLDSTDIATLFLDARLNVRRFTEQARRVVSLREGDIGRPLAELTMHLPYPELALDVQDTLRTLAPRERQLQGPDGCWTSVRVLPYRTLDNRIDGVVLTFVDITAARAAGADRPPPL